MKHPRRANRQSIVGWRGASWLTYVRALRGGRGCGVAAAQHDGCNAAAVAEAEAYG